MSAAIVLRDLSFRRGDRSVLSSLQLQIDAGEHIALLGPSGSGKTTVLRLVLGLEAPTEGTITLSDRVASRDGEIVLPPEERGIAVVFQDLALWPHLTVWRNLSFGLAAHQVPRSEQARRIRAVLDRLSLTDKAQRLPGELSGGERQRVAIARALVLEPAAVLLDEPLANLDAQLKRELLTLFGSVFAERPCAVIYVTHDLHEAAVLAQRLVVLERGEVVQQGTLEDLRSRPRTEFVHALTAGFGSA